MSVFLITIFLFNFFDQTKSYKRIKDYTLENNSKFDQLDLVLVFDEMSGLNSLASKTKEGNEFNNIARKFYEKYNFEFYSNIYSISGNSVSSLSALLNFSNSENIRNEVKKNFQIIFMSMN